MKLHISFNTTDLNLALSIAKQVDHLADGFVLGSLLLMSNGQEGIKQFREKFPDKKISLDTKITDHWNANVSFFAQFNIWQISVLAGTSNAFIQQLSNAAHAKNIKIALDLFGNSGSDQIAFDAQTLDIDTLIYRNKIKDPEKDLLLLEDWAHIQGNTKLPIFIEGGISFETTDLIKSMAPAGIIVGNLITGSNNPAEAAEKIHALLHAPEAPAHEEIID